MYYQAKTDAEVESKFGDELNPETGELATIKHVRHPGKTESKKAKMREKNKMRKLRKKCIQKRGGQEKVNDFSHLKDNITFGEVVSRPPDLTKWKEKFDKYVKNKK